MKYRAKIELYDENEDRVEWFCTDIEGIPDGSDEKNKMAWRMELLRLNKLMWDRIKARLV